MAMIWSQDMLDVTHNDLLFLRRDRQLPGQVDQRLRLR
jgi:hypothetical protein